MSLLTWLFKPLLQVRRLKKQVRLLKSQIDTKDTIIAQLKKRLLVDELTGASSRLGFQQYVEDLAATAVREHDAAEHVLLFIDVDDFADINDKYGHDSGDAVLVDIVKKASGMLRLDGNVFVHIDHIMRWGGDEFVIILYKCPFNVAQRKAEEMSRTLDASCIVSNKVIPYTCSVGCATFNTDARIDEIVKVADEAMYLAKRERKNPTPGDGKVVPLIRKTDQQ